MSESAAGFGWVFGWALVRAISVYVACRECPFRVEYREEV